MNKLHEERLKWENSNKLKMLFPKSPHDLVFILDEKNMIKDCYWQDSGSSWPECWF
jgi:sensor domain CHASE-containing protein